MNIERTTLESGQEVIKIGPHRHELPPMPEGMDNDAAVAWIDSGYKTLGDTIDRIEHINANQRLSEMGKTEQLEPLLGEAYESVAKLSASLDMYESQIESQEANLTSVPELHPHAAVIGQREMEIRQWFRSLEFQDRMEILSRIESGQLSSEIVYALKRTPIGLPAAEREVFDRGWAEACRRNNPKLAAEIDMKRAALDRARRATALIGATTNSVARWDRKKVLEQLVSSKNEMLSASTTLHGYSAYEVAQARQVKAWKDNDKLMGRGKRA
jgi:hypothetical protein